MLYIAFLPHSPTGGIRTCEAALLCMRAERTKQAEAANGMGNESERHCRLCSSRRQQPQTPSSRRSARPACPSTRPLGSRQPSLQQP